MWNALFGSSATLKEPFAHEVTFKLNGKDVTVGAEVSDTMSLNAYIRDVAKLAGTKFMCYEGGCGACLVAANAEHPVTKQRATFSVNSCLVPVLACHGWEVTTTEGLGSKRGANGYHQIQATLAGFNGTQCGFCSPGMVMNMYSLLADGKQPTMAEVENAFSGNLCRCTGYRPILDAFKSLASDAPPKLKKTCADIEDLYKICNKTGKRCEGKCKKEEESFDLATLKNVRVPAVNWYKVTTLEALFATLTEIGAVPYKLVSGNTSEGVYRSSGIVARIDIKDIPDLRTNVSANPLTVGGNTTYTELMNFFRQTTHPAGFEYVTQIADHIDKIANRPVQNIGTIGGNLMLKKQHPEFPSDIFTILDTVGVTLNILTSATTTERVSVSDFLLPSTDMNKKVILSIEFPALTPMHIFKTFKVMPRNQGAIAYVNAGFLVQVQDKTNYTVVGRPRMLFAGINPSFTHANNTEQYLTGKNLLDQATIDGAMASLEAELQPDHVLPDADPIYRKQLAQGLYYKYLLSVDSSKVNPRFQSGALSLQRPLSSAIQDYDTDSSLYPLNEPVPKIEAIAQTAGEAEYLNDVPVLPNELQAIFVLTKVATGTISRVDPGPALSMPGVVAFYQKDDIPGVNNFMPAALNFPEFEEIFCSGTVQYAGQVVGMIVAETRSAALSAAGAVLVEYTNVTKPKITIDDVIGPTKNRLQKVIDKNATVKTETNPEAANVLTGRFDIGKQYHLHMETQSCLVIPIEDGYDVFSATQWIDHVQIAISQALNISANTINVTVRRLGGAYGAKISRPAHLAAACSIAAHKLDRPIRMVMTLGDNMEVMGKRFELRHDYEVGADAAGKMEYLNSQLYENNGFSFNDSPLLGTRVFLTNCYKFLGIYNTNTTRVRTNTASNTSCRAPGSAEGIAFIEEVMERIAFELKLDPLAVRLANMTDQNNPLPVLIEDLKNKADYDARRQLVNTFNTNNRWKKRGMALVPMQWRFTFFGPFSATVVIYHVDGTVAVTHGGIEMGQGINTKVAQVVAHILGISLDMVAVKPSTNISAPNDVTTGGSVGSESVCFAAMISCEELLRRLEPIRETMTNPTWPELIAKAHSKSVDLSARHMFTTKDDVQNYDIWGATIAEVEVDILTGEKEVVRVDIIEDVGQSLSPLIDVGQIEGAFVMGMGYWLSEELKHDPDTGRLLNTRTWNYKVPGAKDIPADFRIYFRRNAPNMNGVLKSKATGEPALCMSVVTFFAVRDALNSARKDAGTEDVQYYSMATPATAEHIFMTSLTNPSQFKLQ